VGREGRGELVVWLVKVAWIKAGLLDYPDQQNGSQKKNGNFVLNTLPALEDRVSMCL